MLLNSRILRQIFLIGFQSGSCQFSWQYGIQDPVIKCQNPRFSLNIVSYSGSCQFSCSILVRILLLNPGSQIFFVGSYSGSCQFSLQYPGQDPIIRSQDPRFFLQDPTLDPVNFPGSILLWILLLDPRILDFSYRILLRILSIFLVVSQSGSCY